MSNKSLLQHWEFLHKDTLGELNFCINKLWDVVYAFVTTIICRLRLLFGGGGLWQQPQSQRNNDYSSFSV